MIIGLVPWILLIAFWLFAIWAVLAVIGALRAIQEQLAVIAGHLNEMGQRGGADAP